MAPCSELRRRNHAGAYRTGDTVRNRSNRAVAIFATSLAAAAAVAMLPTAGNAQVIEADADSYVRSDLATSNFGADLTLLAKNVTGSSFNRKDYIRFTLDPGMAGSITAASFSLDVSDAIVGQLSPANASKTYTFNVFGLLDGAGDNWVEGTGTTGAPSGVGINWNNAPANNTASGSGVTAGATLLGSFNLTGRGTPGQSVGLSGASLVNFLNADTNLLATLIITRVTQENGADAANDIVHAFASREAGPTLAAPTLTVTVPTAVPEPTTLALLPLGGALAMVIARRRKAA